MSQSPAACRRVAIVIDLQWAIKHHQDIYVGIRRYAREHGHWDCTVDLFAGEKLQARGRSAYDGVIARTSSRLASRARRASVPVVNVWLNSPARNVPTVVSDFEAAGAMAAQHLMSRGLRSFGYLGQVRDRMSQRQLAGFRAAVSAAGFACSTHWVAVEPGKSPASWQKFQDGMERWIDTWPRPIGVYVAHDVPARYLIELCERKRVCVPDEAAVVSNYNNLILCLHPEPAISSIEFGFEQVGYEAAALLDRLMGGQPPTLAPIVIAPVELVARRSTDVFTVGDPVVARALRFMAEHGSEPIGVTDVAHHVHTSRRNLERRFRNALGRTIVGEIGRLRIEGVKRQLTETGESLKFVAARFGFRNVRRLCEAFRRLEGMTPGEFRRLRRRSDETD